MLYYKYKRKEKKRTSAIKPATNQEKKPDVVLYSNMLGRRQLRERWYYSKTPSLTVIKNTTYTLKLVTKSSLQSTLICQ